MIRVTIWNEYRHERESAAIEQIYPDGIHGALKSGLSALGDFAIRTATLDEPENGLPENVLQETDVLLWWGHKAHGAVDAETVDRVHRRVLDGMGLLVFVSAVAGSVQMYGDRSNKISTFLTTLGTSRERIMGARMIAGACTFLIVLVPLALADAILLNVYPRLISAGRGLLLSFFVTALLMNVAAYGLGLLIGWTANRTFTTLGALGCVPVIMAIVAIKGYGAEVWGCWLS